MNQSDCIEISKGEKHSVWLTKQVSKNLEKASPKDRARCLKYMGFFANDGLEYLHLDDTKFKKQGDFSNGKPDGKKIPVFAFKAYQLRIYGSFLPGGDFVGTEIDTGKKQDQANKSKLKAAAKKFAALL
ncbi:hypothetical protein [Nisaea sediminum]|uniref:hypothetical protein n=1 Tax=Nisaea sediminum TaxID=2775867 RepID=UPI0018670E2F|nr:hypothetical protein [Nisaea sediminum]